MLTRILQNLISKQSIQDDDDVMMLVLDVHVDNLKIQNMSQPNAYCTLIHIHTPIYSNEKHLNTLTFKVFNFVFFNFPTYTLETNRSSEKICVCIICFFFRKKIVLEINRCIF